MLPFKMTREDWMALQPYVPAIDYLMLRRYVPRYHDQPSFPYATNQNDILFWLAVYLERELMRWNMTTFLRKAHFLAQARAETGDFTSLLERGSDLGGINGGLKYQGRFGNDKPGDGTKYIGHGLLQVTFKSNFAATSRALSIHDTPNRSVGANLETINGRGCAVDFFHMTDDPEQLLTWPMAVRSACAFWHMNNLNGFADADDCLGMTVRIQGSAADYPRRQIYTNKAKALLR